MHLGLVSDKLDLYAQDAYSDISTRNLKKTTTKQPQTQKMNDIHR